jgi:PleD family two-component response regulator
VDHSFVGDEFEVTLELGITASVGVAFAEPHHGPADLLREADNAM